MPESTTGGPNPDHLNLLWASPPMPPEFSPAGARRRTQAELGHATIAATTAAYTTTTTTPKETRPVNAVQVIAVALSTIAFLLSGWAIGEALRARRTAARVRTKP
ncbi:hypothetical protein ACIQ9P_03735 [Kitasatospora sp. NPDC094019]|uniref:hypothetical protein n=1 Tax=Kitasatospora sp. NPDC094019 TaxID=3364091 RepID=UPI0037FBD150